MKHILSLTLAVLLLAGCSSASPPPEKSSTPPPAPPAEQPVIAPVPLPEPEPEPDPRQEAIDKWMSSMPDEQMIGQLFFARCPENDYVDQEAGIKLTGISSLPGISRTKPLRR